MPSNNPRPVNVPLREHTVPLSGGMVIQFVGPFPLSPDHWEQFMTVLAAMRPGLVTEEAESVTSPRPWGALNDA